MSTVPRLTERYERRVELISNDLPSVAALRVGAANTLTTAFAGTTAMFDVPNPGTFRSPYIRRKRWGLTQYHNRGLSRALFDPEDYWPTAPAVLPHDADISFIRVSEIDHSGAVRPEGPILVVPPPGFFSTPRPVLTLQGDAPDVAGTPTGLPPMGSMHVYMPRFFDYCNVTNKGGAPLWLSFGRGLPEIEIGAGVSRDIYDAADNEILIRGQGAVVAFDGAFALVNGEMA
jgi:hypothetical protein